MCNSKESNMRWHLGHLIESIEKRKNQKVCPRCNILHLKTLEECPHCTGIDDNKLKYLLNKRKKFREGIGKGMLIASVVIILLLIIMNA